MIDVFNPLVYGPMTLVILGFTEAASRRREHRIFYLIATTLILMVVLAEVAWSARGLLSCGDDRDCTAQQETGQLYFFVGWAVTDCIVTAGFVMLLYKSLASLRKARWHLLSLGTRSLAIIILAVVGLAHKDRLTREAQVDIAMALSVCFLVVRTFRSLVFSAKATTAVYPSQQGHRSGHRTKRSNGFMSGGRSTSSQQHINTAEERAGSDDNDGDIELNVVYARDVSGSVERSIDT